MEKNLKDLDPYLEKAFKRECFLVLKSILKDSKLEEQLYSRIYGGVSPEQFRYHFPNGLLQAIKEMIKEEKEE